MQTLRIVIIDDHQQVAMDLVDWATLPEGTFVRAFDVPFSSEDVMVAQLADFDVVVAMRERTHFGSSAIGRLPRLKMLATTGLRNAAIDLQACLGRGIVVTGARGAAQSLSSTAELAWSLILGLCKQIPSGQDAARSGHWQPTLAQGLHGKVLGLAGLGHVGSRMALLGQAFGMEVLAWSSNLKPERARAHGVEAVSRHELFQRSDVLSMHLGLGPATAGLVDDDLLRLMKPGAYFINTARAGLVQEQALMEALRERRIAGAGLDVFWQEPVPAGHALLQMDNVLITPHLGYVTRENLQVFYQGVLDNIRAWIDGRPVLALNPSS